MRPPLTTLMQMLDTIESIGPARTRSEVVVGAVTDWVQRPHNGAAHARGHSGVCAAHLHSQRA